LAISAVDEEEKVPDFENVNKEFLYKRAALKWAPWPKDVISLSVADIDFPASRDIQEGVIRAVNEDPWGRRRRH
jgi:bifunctional pyridoxal-dependent enzyme with beta-cystathionase and maltose regulon repressor activities